MKTSISPKVKRGDKWTDWLFIVLVLIGYLGYRVYHNTHDNYAKQNNCVNKLANPYIKLEQADPANAETYYAVAHKAIVWCEQQYPIN